MRAWVLIGVVLLAVQSNARARSPSVDLDYHKRYEVFHSLTEISRRLNLDPREINHELFHAAETMVPHRYPEAKFPIPERQPQSFWTVSRTIVVSVITVLVIAFLTCLRAWFGP